MINFRIVLVGQPNVGKSSLINAISGARMRVGNFSGVTVEKAEANVIVGNHRINIIDLPGTYSLNGYTLEEKISKQFLESGEYDIILNVLDSTNLERNLVLSLQLLELRKPLFLALNMIDEAKNDKIEIDTAKLSNMLKCPVCAVSSSSNENIKLLIESLCKFYDEICEDSNNLGLDSKDSKLPLSFMTYPQNPTAPTLIGDAIKESGNLQSPKHLKNKADSINSQNLDSKNTESNTQDSKENTESTLQDSIESTNAETSSVERQNSQNLDSMESKNSQIDSIKTQEISPQPPRKGVDKIPIDSKENTESAILQNLDSKENKESKRNSPMSSALSTISHPPTLTGEQSETHRRISNDTTLQADSTNSQNLDSKNTESKTQDSKESTEIPSHKMNCHCNESPKDNLPKFTNIKWSKIDKNKINDIKMTSQIALKARQIAKGVQKLNKERDKLSHKIDNILLNKYLAIPIFLLSMFAVFELTFYIGEFFKGYIEDFIDFAANFAKEHIANATLSSLISDGIIRGVGAPLSFLPLIATLFLGLTLLEGSGYMARVAFLLDGLFVRFGLHGKSFIPLVMGFGCSVPAYMATRTLQNKSDRLITMFVIGFMSCSARLPIYLLFIGAFFPSQWGAAILFGIYLGGAIIGLICAKILKITAFKGSNEPFVMEMPRYRVPSLRVVWFSVWSKCLMFLKKAGSVILVGAIFIWAIATFPHSDEIDEKYERRISALESSLDSADSKVAETAEDFADSKVAEDSIESKAPEDSNENIESKIKDLENMQLQEQLEYSIAGRIGHFMQPFFAPLGFDWRLSVALLTGFSAKEMVVTTLGVLYALGDAATDDESENKALQHILQKNVSLPSAVAFIMFIMLYIPCFAATIAFTYESGKKIYTLYLFLFTTAVAYFFAYIAHEITRILM